ncbi:hypothetical protein BHE74_00013190 [Ensete ventricosum]|nr:hypothetical protein BHE74_00013190 [Ensete ventricosum]
MDYINRLDNFDGPAVGEVAVEAQLYEEAFAIFKKFNLNVQAVNVLLDNIQSIERAVEFAFRVEEDAVWSQVAKAQLRQGLVSDSIESFIRADDETQFLDVIRAAEDANVYHDLVKYLLMVRQKVKEPKVDGELIFAYAKIDRLGEIEEFILMPNVANLQNVGDRLFDDALYEAAKIIFAFISNWAKLASTLVRLKQFQGAFKDVIVKVANVELYYKAVHFYLQEHPDLINDVLHVLALRVDHTHVVDIMRKIEKHELLEMRRIAAYIYKKAGRWKQSIALSKKDNLYKDAMETCSQSGDRELSEELLIYFIEQKTSEEFLENVLQGKKECFASCLFICYELIHPDVALELAWMNNMIDFAFPYLLQVICQLSFQ